MVNSINYLNFKLYKKSLKNKAKENTNEITKNLSIQNKQKEIKNYNDLMNAEKDSICIVTNCYLANVTNESNYIILACKIDDHQVYMHDGNLNRYGEYQKLANSKENCEFKISNL